MNTVGVVFLLRLIFTELIPNYSGASRKTFQASARGVDVSRLMCLELV